MAYTDIDKPSDYFNTVTWTGNGSKITTGLRPDLIWYKARDVSSYGGVVNAIRGDDYYLQTYSTDAETYYSGLLVSDSTGFTPSSIFTTNSYVAWNWLAGGTGASNTVGDINSTVSANTTSGFSIVSFTGNGSAGATVGHGLGVKPATIIIKARSKVGQNWIVWHQTFPNNNDYMELNTTDAKDTYDLFNNTAPTSSLFSLSSDGNVNSNTDTYIAYCFAEKKGFSKFGSYTGNGSTDGTFVYTGFKPAMVIIKRTSGADRWVISDNKRDPDNPVIGELNPNDSVAEDTTSTPFDFLSNGFKIRRIGNVFNGSGETYIYMCFAENPFVTSTSIPCTAR